jgi:hypothetical protein
MFRRWIFGNSRGEAREIRKLLLMQGLMRFNPDSRCVVLQADAAYIGLPAPGSLQGGQSYMISINYDHDRQWITVDIPECQVERVYRTANKLLDDWFIDAVEWQVVDADDGTPVTGINEIDF